MRFRISYGSRWPFRLVCASTVLLPAAIVANARELAALECVLLGLLAIASAIGMSLTVPGTRWIEIEIERRRRAA